MSLAMYEDTMGRLRKICDKDRKNYTFNINVSPNPTLCKGTDSVNIVVLEDKQIIHSYYGSSIEECLMGLELKFKPKPETIIVDGKKYIEVIEEENPWLDVFGKK